MSREQYTVAGMLLANDREKTLFTWSAALAIASVCAIFVASKLQTNLLFSIIDKGVFLPILGAVFFVRVIVGTFVFFSPERPPETRTFRAFFYRDKWLSDRLKLSQPQSVIVLGSSLIFFKLSMLVAILVAAICVFARVMLLGQAVSMFVVGTMLLVGYQAIAGIVLLLRQIYTLRMEKHR